MATIGSIDIIQNSQDKANNISKITVKGYCETTNGYWRGDWRTGTYTIKQGSKVLKSGSFTHGAPANTKTTLFEVELTVTHDVNGNSGTITVTFDYDSGWCKGSQTKTLTKINRKSTLSVDNGTLDTEQILEVTRQSTSFTHTITYECGETSGTICTKSSDTSIEWIPPLSLASQNTTGRTLTIVFTITTYNGSTSLGSNSCTKTFTIPKDVAPSVKYTIEEANEKLLELGWNGYVQNLSQLKIDITATPAYGSEIVSYKTEIDGKIYKENSFTTDVLTSGGTLPIYIYVTDERGGESINAIFPDVEQYAKPIIKELKVKRCNADGKEYMRGEYGKVTFEIHCSPLSVGNEVVFDVYYKKSTETEYTFHETVGYGAISGESGELSSIFPANTSYSYNVKIVARDLLEESERSTSLSSGFSIIHFLATGLGIAFGKVAELDNVLDIGFKTRFFGGIKLMDLADGTDLNALTTTNIYRIKSDYDYPNKPNARFYYDEGILEVLATDGGYVKQVFHPLSTLIFDHPDSYVRIRRPDIWGDWVCTNGDFVVEEGISGIWTYRKWNNGVCEMWGTYEFTPSWANSSSPYYQNITLEPPFPLTQIDSFIPSVKYSNFATTVVGKTYKLDAITFMIQQTNSSKNSTEISLEIKGRWKSDAVG